MSDLSQGLALSGYGILITFSALGILIGLILLLKALFPHRDTISKREESQSDLTEPPELDRKELLKRAAAAGVSVLIQQENRAGRGSLGKLLEDPTTDWWRKGVDRIQGKE